MANIYNIDNSRLSKFNLKENKYINNFGEGISIRNDIQIKIQIIGSYIKLYTLIIYTDKITKYENLTNNQIIFINKSNYRIELYSDNEKIIEVKFDPTNKPILLHLDSFALGDTLAWMPYIEDYYNKWKPSKLYITNFWNKLFYSSNKNIQLVDHYDKVIPGEIYDFNSLGYDKNGNHRNKNIQQVITDLMGIKYVEKRPKMVIPNLPKPNYGGKYVCISEHGTDQSKMWNNPTGWQELVDYLNSIGYKVVVISYEPTNLKGVINKTGNIDILDRVNDILYSEFFIGLSSGLSWLAWALNKKVVMISGITLPFNEFKDKNIRIINTNVCHGCWNKNLIKTNGNCMFFGDRQFECTKTITSEMVIDKIKTLF